MPKINTDIQTVHTSVSSNELRYTTTEPDERDWSLNKKRVHFNFERNEKQVDKLRSYVSFDYNTVGTGYISCKIAASAQYYVLVFRCDLARYFELLLYYLIYLLK